MKKIVLGALCAAAALTAASAADARQGCGLGWHRGPYGHCRPNGYGARFGPRVGPRVVVATPVVGVYYRGHGYWDGRRYWWRRYHWHGGWRYR